MLSHKTRYDYNEGQTVQPCKTRRCQMRQNRITSTGYDHVEWAFHLSPLREENNVGFEERLEQLTKPWKILL